MNALPNDMGAPRLHGDTNGAIFFMPDRAPPDWRTTCERRASERAQQKAHNLARYLRRYSRHQPITAKKRVAAAPMRLGRYCTRGFVPYMKRVVAMMFGQPGKWGHGRWSHATAKGPGLRRIPPKQQNHPAGTRLVKRFIRDAMGEQVEYRKLYARLTGKQLDVAP